MYKKNQYLSQKLYNEEFKNRYLEAYEGGTRRFYRYVFQKSFDLETLYKKDLHHFNMQELDDLIKTYQNGTVEAIGSIVTILRKYIDFSIKEGYVPTRINYLKTIASYDALAKYLNIKKIKNNLISKKDLLDIYNNCENAQDAICFALPYYGIKGNENKDMLNLTIRDIDFTNNIIRLQDRTVQVDDFLIELILETSTERYYVKSNGLLDNANYRFPLASSKYIIKTGAKVDIAPSNQLIVNSRIRRISKHLGYQSLTPSGVMYSGFYHKYIEIKDEKGNIEKEDIVKIMQEFGLNEAYWWRIYKKMQEFEKKDDIL